MSLTPSSLQAQAELSPRLGSDRSPRRRLLTALLGGGTDGNEELTAWTGAVLIVLLAVIGVTILRKVQLIEVHLFVGLLLIGPVALKMASTGYRFVRYYTRNAAYRRKGAPVLALRALAPLVVLTTMLVFASGIVLLFESPSHRGPWVTIHKLSFIAWLAFTALHVLGHLPQISAALRLGGPQIRGPAGARGGDDGVLAGTGGGGLARGAAGRFIALAGACVGGVVLAVLLMGHFAPWNAPGAFPHHFGHH